MGKDASETVHRVELYHVEVPCEETFHPSWLPAYPQTENRFTLLKLETKDGVTGWGAGTAFNREREGLGALLGPYLVGTAVDDLDTVRQRIREASYLGWRNPWIEMAFLDLWGKLEDKPVVELLGGKPRTLPAYTSTGVTTTTDNAEAQVQLGANLGTDIVKLRAHSSKAADDEAMLSLAAKMAEDQGLRLAVDANQGWYVNATGPAVRWDLDHARAFAKACASHGVAWLEEPLDMHDVRAMQALREESDVPIAGGELLGDFHAFRPLLDMGCLDKYQPDATLCGGAETSLRVAKACAEQDLSFAPHTWSNGFGLVFNAHILAATDFDGPLEWPYDPPGWTPPVRDGVLTEPLALDETGRFELPDGPGLGIDVDEEQLKAFGDRFYKATPGKVAWRFMRDKGVGETLRYMRRRKKGD